jgi:hypothetical protein
MKFFEPSDMAALTHEFPHLPFGLKHRFYDNPLLTLPRLADLARNLPRGRLDYDAGNTAISRRPEMTPTIDLEPEEIIHTIETAGASLVLRSIEQDPACRRLIEAALMEVAQARGYNSLKAAGFEDIRGVICVSSANAMTPFRADAEETFFFQIHGDTFFHVYDNRDRSIASEEALEAGAIEHRNLSYRAEFDKKCTTYRLKAGDGVFVPYQWPHWTRTADACSISLSLAWTSDEVRRRNDIAAINAMLRGFGLPQHPPGVHPTLDAAKVAAFRAAAAAVESLRRNEPLHRFVHRIVKGREGNDGYRGGKKPQSANAS